MCYQANLCNMFQSFHLEKCIKKISTIGYGAVVGHEDCVVFRDEGRETGCDFISPCGCVTGQRDRTKSHNRFLAEHLVERPPRAGEGCRDNRMGVNDGSDILSFPVNSEMHADFAGYFSRAG